MLFSGLVTMPSFAISIALIRNKYSSNICDIFAVQQGKEGCSWLVGVRHSLMRVQSRKRLFPSGGYKECGNSSAHHSKMRSARYRSAQRWLGRIQKTATFTPCQQAPSCCARSPFCGSTNRRAHTGGGIRVESAETGTEKEKGAAQRRSTILPGRENVAAVERGQLSSNYAQFPCHFTATVSNRYSGTLNLY